jgi:hypothetical protein
LKKLFIFSLLFVFTAMIGLFGMNVHAFSDLPEFADSDSGNTTEPTPEPTPYTPSSSTGIVNAGGSSSGPLMIISPEDLGQILGPRPKP